MILCRYIYMEPYDIISQENYVAIKHYRAI